MLGIRYFKADSSTFVIKSINGKVRSQGRGLSFFFNSAITSIAAIPMSVQEAPFIIGLSTADYQTIRVQGQVSFQVTAPEKTAAMLNFNLKSDGVSYLSEDPMKLSDVVVRLIQSLVQDRMQLIRLREALGQTRELLALLNEKLSSATALSAMGISVQDVTISAITPTPETSKALEAEAREAILKEADDAIYSRRKSAVEQERTIKEAELQTELSIQHKQQEIEESRIKNERTILLGEVETAREKLLAEIAAENQRSTLVTTSVENRRMESDAEAYAIDTRMKAFSSLPVENLKAMAMANMQPEQLLALAFESLAQNANKIGELNISPELFSQLARKVNRGKAA